MGLCLCSVGKAYHSHDGATSVLRDVSITIADGESVGIVGESGVGKSTLINLVAGYAFPDSGSITCDGQRVIGPGPERVVVSQQDSLYPWLTVRENARYAAIVGHYRGQRNEIADRADSLLQRFGLWPYRHKFPNFLSGGQRRRVELVRAFAVVPRVLLLDEPYSSLDEGLRTDLGEYLLEWRRESPRVCTVLVTHDIEEACFLVDRILILGGQPASIVAEEWVGFGPYRDALLRLDDDYQSVVRRVRHRYHEVRNARLAVPQ